jgi:hypothetical protein
MPSTAGRKMKIRAVTVQESDILYSEDGIAMGHVRAKYTDFGRGKITVWVQINNANFRARQDFDVNTFVTVKREKRA